MDYFLVAAAFGLASLFMFDVNKNVVMYGVFGVGIAELALS